MHSGHYYCFVKAPNGVWNKMDDSTVGQVRTAPAIPPRWHAASQPETNLSRRALAPLACARGPQWHDPTSLTVMMVEDASKLVQEDCF